MSDKDLKSRLNAKVRAENERGQQASVEQKKLAEVATREVPRLTNELLTRIESILSKTDELNIDHSDSTHVTGHFGDYIVPVIKITFMRKERITFKPGGFGRDGANGTIAIVSQEELRYAQIGMIPSKADLDRWILAVKDKKQSSGPWLELTDKMLEDLLGDALDP